MVLKSNYLSYFEYLLYYLGKSREGADTVKKVSDISLLLIY